MKEEMAAGGVVFRRDQDQWSILLIKDRFGFWAFPKGKKEPGETTEETALREIFEETQIQGEIVKKLTTISYFYQHPVHGSVNKQVTYFLVQAKNGKEVPQVEEILETKWFPLHQAEKKLIDHSYSNNIEIFSLAKEELNRLACF